LFGREIYGPRVMAARAMDAQAKVERLAESPDWRRHQPEARHSFHIGLLSLGQRLTDGCVIAERIGKSMEHAPPTDAVTGSAASRAVDRP
jgi:hypothetical protein